MWNTKYGKPIMLLNIPLKSAMNFLFIHFFETEKALALFLETDT
jgi:hypothetical protein